MDHFFELVLELLFGFIKKSPDSMPEIEYKDNFVVKYPRKKLIPRICATLIFVCIFSLLIVFIRDRDCRILFTVFVGAGAILLICQLFQVSLVCIIDEVKISSRMFYVFRKNIAWQDIVCIRVVKQTNEKSVVIAIYDSSGKCVIDCGSNMENAWYIVKMAERKEIEIRNEKDLSIKQLAHL